MNFHKHESLITALVMGAGFALVAAWFSLLTMEARMGAPGDRAAAESCSICGVVERVSQRQRRPRR